MNEGWRRQADQVFRLIDKILLTVANTALVAIVFTITWSVWTRYVMRSPVTWGEDVTSMAFAWFIFIGMAAVHNRRGHVGIDIVTSLFPTRVQTVLTFIGDVFVAIFCGYTAYLCAEQAIVSHSMAETPVLEIPLSYFFASLTIGFAIMSIRSVGFALGIGPIPTEMPIHE